MMGNFTRSSCIGFWVVFFAALTCQVSGTSATTHLKNTTTNRLARIANASDEPSVHEEKRRQLIQEPVPFEYDLVRPLSDDNVFARPGLILAATGDIICVVDPVEGREWLLATIPGLKNPGDLTLAGPLLIVTLEVQLIAVRIAPPFECFTGFPCENPIPLDAIELDGQIRSLAVPEGGTLGPSCFTFDFAALPFPSGYIYFPAYFEGKGWGFLPWGVGGDWAEFIPLSSSLFSSEAVIAYASPPPTSFAKSILDELYLGGDAGLVVVRDGANSGLYLYNGGSIWQLLVPLPSNILEVTVVVDDIAFYLADGDTVSRFVPELVNREVIVDFDNDFTFSLEEPNIVVVGGEIFTRFIVLQGGRVKGDPHLVTWKGEKYDFMGECDLVLVDCVLEDGKSLKIHIRTKIIDDWSYISSAVVKIGKDILEVQSGGEHVWNGPAGEKVSLGGYEMKHSHPYFRIELGKSQSILIKNHKMISVSVNNPRYETFGDSVGLFGDFRTGQKLARDGKTVIENPNDFGTEWQVRDSEPMLFSHAEGPQFPSQKCLLPKPKVAMESRKGRRLRGMSRGVAEEACTDVDPKDFDFCVGDVLATNNLDIVAAY